MNNPAFPINCKEGAYVLVAENVTSGTLIKKRDSIKYYQTYRLYDPEGVSPPTDFSESAEMFGKNLNGEAREFVFSSSEAVNIYVWCKGGDGVLRVDI